MNRGRVVSLVAGIAVVTGLLGASVASAATLIGNYQFQGTRASSGPGQTLTDVGAGSNSFTTNNVMGVTRQVLTFPAHSGVKLSPAGLGSGPVAYSAVMTFEFTGLTSGEYTRVLDPSNGTDDDGFYAYDGFADIYPAGTEVTATNRLFENNVYVTAAITSDPNGPLSRFYVNGNLQASAPEVVPVVADALRFFKDNDTATTNEDAPGAVSCIRVFSGALTDAEVGSIGASPNCQPPPAPVAKKKCKKHKKKHRSAETAKKKCKKKKKR
jgi:Concanavalin A-like lectin/glucanases superfamily